MDWKLKLTMGFILVIMLFSLLYGFSESDSWRLQAGQLIMLTVTLIVLIFYAKDTNRIANATEKKWEEEHLPKLIYEINVSQKEPQSPQTFFSLINPTDYLINASINCNFKIYGESVLFSGAYEGSEMWIIFPNQGSTGLFSIETLLQKKGKTIEQMIKERNRNNASEQLTMDLEIEFENETHRTRSYPSRKHHFDFERWTWIPVLTKPYQR